MAQIDSPAAKRPLKIVAGADDFGCSLKDALVAQLRALNIEVEDLGTSKYYSVGEEIGRRVSEAAKADSAVETRGLVACGTGVGVAIFANKFPGVYAATCLTPADALNARSINNCNVLAVSGMSTAPEAAADILTTFLNTPFKSPARPPDPIRGPTRSSRSSTDPSRKWRKSAEEALRRQIRRASFAPWRNLGRRRISPQSM